jgi:hypothetical protein
MDPSTSVCDIFNIKSFMKITLLAWLQIGLGPFLRWGHRHDAAIADTTRINRYWTL